MKLLTYLAVVLILTGCNSKQKVGYFDDQKSEQQAIINTKKAQFYIQDKRFLLAATYLNSLKSFDHENEEMFLITIYSNDLKNSKNFITGAILNGEVNGIDWRDIGNENPLTKYSPIANKWSQYFVLHAPKSKSINLRLILQIDRTKRVVLDFEKPFLYQH